MYILESSLIKYKNTQVAFSLGTPASVEFDWMALYEFRLSVGKDAFDPEEVIFYHVHPPGFLQYSQLDKECLTGFTRALGHPVRFAIVVFEGDRYRSVTYRLIDEEMVREKNTRLTKADAALLRDSSHTS